MGRNTFNVSMKLFEENRRRLVERLRFLFNIVLLIFLHKTIIQSIVFWRLKVKDGNGVVLLMSATHPKGYSHGDSSNAHPVFIQEGYFHWYFFGKPLKIKYHNYHCFSGVLVYWSPISLDLLTSKQERVFCSENRHRLMLDCGWDILPPIRRLVIKQGCLCMWASKKVHTRYFLYFWSDCWYCSREALCSDPPDTYTHTHTQ